MKEVVQDLRSVDTVLEDVPCSGLGQNMVLVQTLSTVMTAAQEHRTIVLDEEYAGEATVGSPLIPDPNS